MLDKPNDGAGRGSGKWLRNTKTGKYWPWTAMLEDNKEFELVVTHNKGTPGEKKKPGLVVSNPDPKDTSVPDLPVPEDRVCPLCEKQMTNDHTFRVHFAACYKKKQDEGDVTKEG